MSNKQFRVTAITTTAFSPHNGEISPPTSPTTNEPPLEGKRRLKKKRSKQQSFELLKMQMYANQNITPPHQLAREGNLEEMKAMIENFGLTLKEVDDSGQTMLHAATKTGQIHVMQYLIGSGININEVDSDGNTALHIAVINEQIEALCLLMENKASDTILNNEQNAPLHTLFRSHNKDLIAAFLQYPSIELVVPGYRKRTPLHVIAEEDNIDALELLHSSISLTKAFKDKVGFRLCASDEDNLTPIHLAARVGSARALDSMMSKCMSHGYPPVVVLSFLDEENSTPLHVAVDGGFYSVVEVLLKHGADSTHSKGNQPPPIHVACSQGKLDMVRKMVEVGGRKIVQVHDQFGQTCLHRSASAINCTHIISYLINLGVEVNAIDNHGRTPLIYTIIVGNLSGVRELLSNGADPTIKDSRGLNALHFAIDHHRKPILGCLLDHPTAQQMAIDGDLKQRCPIHHALTLGYGDLVAPLISVIRQRLDSCIDSVGNNFLHLAAESGDYRALEILLDIPSCQTLLNKTNNCGATPLHKASGNGHAKCMEILLSHGAMSHRCNMGVTPFHYACLMGFLRCAQMAFDAHPFQKDWVDDKGNSALHLAAQSGKPCIIKLVLDLGVSIAHNHEGLSFFDLIIEKPDAKCAHAVIIHDRWEECLDLVSPYRQHPMLGLIQRLPQVAKVVLDRCQMKSSLDKEDPQHWVKFNFKYLKLCEPWKEANEDNGDEQKSATDGNEENMIHETPHIVHARQSLNMAPNKPFFQKPNIPRCKSVLESLRAMNNYKRISLLTHPVVESYIKCKWRDYGRMVYLIYIFFFVIQVFLVSAFIISTPNPTTVKKTGDEPFNSSGSGDNDDGETIRISLGSNIVRFLTFFTATLNILTWIPTTFSLGFSCLNIVRNAFVLVDFLGIMFTVIYLIPYDGLNSAVWPLGALASFFCWFGLFLKLQPFDLFGVYVTMFMAITRSVLLVLSMCFPLIAAFSLSFYVLVGDIPVFSKVGYSFFTNFGYMLGEIDYSLFILEDKTGELLYRNLTFTFVIVVAILMSIVIMNLLIGLAVGDIDAIRRNAIAEKRTLEVSIFTRLDFTLPKTFLQKYNRKSYTSFPNSKRSPLRRSWRFFWRSIKNNDGDEESFENDDVRERHFELVHQLQDMRERLDDITHVNSRLLDLIQKLQKEDNNLNDDSYNEEQKTL